MKLFYAKNLQHTQEIVGEEFQHLKALRVKQGEIIHLTDGKGGHLTAEVTSISRRSAAISHRHIIQESTGRSYKVHIFIAPTKNAQRVEFFIEKSIEIGIDAITFIESEQSERSTINYDRLLRKAIAAIKQTSKFHLPEMHSITLFEDAITSLPSELNLIAHLDENTQSLKGILKQISPTSISILIGPEGDFTLEEVHRATACGWKSISLGSSVMRTETAGVAVIGFCYYELALS